MDEAVCHACNGMMLFPVTATAVTCPSCGTAQQVGQLHDFPGPLAEGAPGELGQVFLSGLVGGLGTVAAIYAVLVVARALGLPGVRTFSVSER